MQRAELNTWCLATIVTLIASAAHVHGAPIATDSQAEPTNVVCRKSYDSIVRSLRNNWESPISYLRKRGYIPKKSHLAKETKAKFDEFTKKVYERGSLIDHLASADLHQPVPDSVIFSPPKKSFLTNIKDKLMGLFTHADQKANSYIDKNYIGSLEPSQALKNKILVDTPTKTQNIANTYIKRINNELNNESCSKDTAKDSANLAAALYTAGGNNFNFKP